MTTITASKWVKVNRRNPCTVCGKPDWCLISQDGKAAICARIESNKPAGNKGAGWTHTLDNATPSPPVKSRPDTKQNLRRAAWVLKIIKKTAGENVSRETAPDATQTAPELQEVVAKLVHYG